MRLGLFLLVLGLWPLASCTPGASGCATAADCSAGFACVVDGADSVCAPACAADKRCADGTACVLANGAVEGACLRLGNDLPLDATCTQDRDCASGACIGDTSKVCAQVCTPGDDCPGTRRCALDVLRHVCAEPTDDLADGSSCTSSLQCTSGTCVIAPTEDTAQCSAACSADADCVDALVCARLEFGARACVALVEDGARCDVTGDCVGGFCVQDRDGIKKCASACGAEQSCVADFFCVADDNGADVCLPRLDNRARGESCASNRECQSGLCRHFVDADAVDLGTLCSEPCADVVPRCEAPMLCWGGTPPVCGPG